MRDGEFLGEVLDLAQAIADFENDEVVAGFRLKRMDFRILPLDDDDCFFPDPQRVVEPSAHCEYDAPNSSAR